MTIEERHTRRNSREKREWDTLCEDIARVLHCDPGQIERVAEKPGVPHILIVMLGGKNHLVDIRSIALAKRKAIHEAAERSRRAAEDIYARAKRQAHRKREHPYVTACNAWNRRWGKHNAYAPFMVESDGTLDMHPSQIKVIS